MYKKASKVYAMTCGYAVDGLGFYYIPHAATIRSKGDGKSAMIRVVEGCLNATQVTAEMERLVPGKGKWVVEEVNSNTFRTVFPSKNEMQRMIEWGMVQSKDRQAKMIIEESGGGSGIKQVMRKVWVQMTGLPGELRDFLTIWAIGTILGVTKDVDMSFTREHERARLQVLVLDSALIPLSVDVVIGENVYELHFRVEPEEIQDKPELLDMEDNDTDKRDDDGAENGDNQPKHMQVDKVVQNSSKGGANSDLNNQSNGQHGSHKGKNMLYHIPALEIMSEPDLLHWESTDVQSVDGDDVQNLEEVYTEPISSDSEGPNSESVTPVAEAQVVDMAAIPEADTPMRRSKRRAETADEPSLERAERIKAARNMDTTQTKGNNSVSQDSFIHYSNEQVVHNLNALGISLGNSLDSVSSSCF
jgi:hypothetical protein